MDSIDRAVSRSIRLARAVPVSNANADTIAGSLALTDAFPVTVAITFTVAIALAIAVAHGRAGPAPAG
jgi:hypothetical protein